MFTAIGAMFQSIIIALNTFNRGVRALDNAVIVMEGHSQKLCNDELEALGLTLDVNRQVTKVS
ncbi:hypothetical protein [Zhongshania marina]|uniref:Uncharacterized protein n=1 Tax=Zhongshania marina TaxID=2304603 RepID=A0ABX9W2L6_9GAMM|nr:hypothetical protein D0911_10060 [Zhongshania marina]